MQGVQAEGSPSRKENLERGISKGKVEFSAAPSLETLHRFEGQTLSSEPRGESLREKGHLESRTQSRIVSWYFGCSLVRPGQPAGVLRRLEQPVVGIHSWEGEERAQPRQLCGALSACSFCAALKRFSFGKQVWRLKHQTFGERNHWERGAVWGAGAEEQTQGTHGMEVGSLQRLRGAGR